MKQPPYPEAFIGRDRELAVLDEFYDSNKAELFVLYGRRRVGKTELLQRFAHSRRAVYFLAAQVREKDNLRAFKEALREGLSDPLIDTVQFADWASALGFAAERAGEQRLALVLDEFPYLCEGTKGLPSILQQFWDKRGKRSKLMLVLCGSQISFMEDEVLAERSPLFGRRTGQRRLEPLVPPDTLQFFARWKLEERLLAYSILGGMPAYLRRFDDRVSLRENLLREVLRPEGFLFDEAQFLLKSELNNPATYNSILAAVAGGAQKVGDIALTVGIDATTANKYLHVLRELRLVERELPPTETDPLRSRRGLYRIADRFLAFHYRHLQPNLSRIEAGRGDKVLSEQIEPDFPRLLDEARVDFVLDHLRRQAGTLLNDEITEVGRHPGTVVRALARTSSGQAVAALVWPDPPHNLRRGSPGARLHADAMQAALEAELVELRRAFGNPLRQLAYGITGKPEAPLGVELLG